MSNSTPLKGALIILASAVWPIDSEVNKQDVWTSMKMSKSKPDSAIFIHDSEEDIKRKISKAFCPEKETEFNPIVDWAEYLLFNRHGSLLLERDRKHGGSKKYLTIQELKTDFSKGLLHPADLKNLVANELITILEPARNAFSKGKPAKMLQELDAIIHP